MMTEVLAPDSAAPAPGPRRATSNSARSAVVMTPLGAALAGVATALRAAAASALPITAVVLVAWAAGGERAGAPDALRAAGVTWLVAHGVDVRASTGTVRLSPLGLMVLPAWALWACSGRTIARSAQRRGRPPTRAELSLMLQGLVLSYAALLVAVGIVTRSQALAPSLFGAAVAGVMLALLAGGAGGLRALRRAGSWPLPAVPARAGTALAGALTGAAALCAAGAIMLAAAIALHADRMNALSAGLQPGVVGGAVLAILGVAFVPNAVVWCSAYALGPGFAVGTATAVAPSGVTLSLLPAFPMLAALPAPGNVGALGLVPVLAPALAGVLAGLVVARRTPAGTTRDGAAALGALAGAGAGVFMGVMAALSGGGLGDGRLATVGPSPLRVAFIAALQLGVAAAATAWLARRPE